MKTLLIALALLSQCSKAKNPAESNTQKQVVNRANNSADSLSTTNTQNIETSHNDYAVVYSSEDQKRIENILAKYANHGTSASSLIITLRQIRYVGGKVSYPTRQHYFTEWIDENTKDGFVEELQTPTPPFTAIQHLRINFMSKHTSLYPMLKNNPELVKPIAEMESRLSGNVYRFIPKASIANTQLFRSTIHDGDIIAITTSKSGLDTSHIGIAVWHKDGLHMLNASQIHKKVVEEPRLSINICRSIHRRME